MTQRPDLTERRHLAAMGLSVLLHVLVTLLLQMDGLALRLPDMSERTVEVEVVAEPPSRQRPQPQPPPPPPETPRMRQPSEPPLPLQRPQLQPAPTAEKSSAPRASAKAEPAKPATQKPAPGLAAEMGNFSRPAPAAGDLAQSAQDKVLAQVLRMWHFNSSLLKGSDVSLSATLIVNRDGTLSGPMHKDAPWDPDAAILNYSSMPDGIGKRMLETFLLALRMAQPLQLPPDDGKPWPRRMLLHFRPEDL